MAERETSAEQTQKRVLEFDKKFEIKTRLEMIIACKHMIKSVNAAVVQYPGNSELAAEVVQGNKNIIEIYTNEIRRIRNGETKLY